MAHGAAPNHDPNGNVLWIGSFADAFGISTREARRLYLSEFEEDMFKQIECVDGIHGVKLAADCGILPAINHVNEESIKRILSRQSQ